MINMELKFIYLAYNELTNESREFETKKLAEGFVKAQKKEDRKNKINSKWQIFREERYYG